MQMIAIGDSVVWGQGLLPDQKFTSLVNASLTGAAAPIILAHSGAIIGARVTQTKPTLNGEVPNSYPTIIQQNAAFADASETVDLVIVNGGINDVDIHNILNPLTDTDDLTAMITQYCYRDAGTLLGLVAQKFRNAQIVITGYYPILSRQSNPIQIPQFLDLHGVPLNGFLTELSDIVLAKVIGNCSLFWEQSTQMLQSAVDDTNASLSTNRICFIQVPFTEANAALAPNSWLWGVNPDLSPQDPMAAQRHQACDLDEPDLIQRQTCYRASAGHPNVVGAQKFAEAILYMLR
jgi:lysophospholipase L1-like esterase